MFAQSTRLSSSSLAGFGRLTRANLVRGPTVVNLRPRFGSSSNAAANKAASPKAPVAATPPPKGEWLNPFGLPMWSEEELNAVKVIHRPQLNLTDRIAKLGVTICRTAFDKLSGYEEGKMTERKWILRACFLETVAGIPGFLGGMVRHLSSLRNMKRDRGFINCLLAEAENERMHLLTFITMLQPGLLFRTGVIVTQGILANVWFLVYAIYPKIAHRFVGYLEEEAVRTYTVMLKDIDRGVVFKDTPAPDIAKTYWQLPQDATFRDVILAVRADEANHRDVNHVLADLPKDATNPFVFSKHVVHNVYVSHAEAEEAEASRVQLQKQHESKAIASKQ